METIGGCNSPEPSEESAEETCPPALPVAGILEFLPLPACQPFLPTCQNVSLSIILLVVSRIYSTLQKPWYICVYIDSRSLDVAVK